MTRKAVLIGIIILALGLAIGLPATLEASAPKDVFCGTAARTDYTTSLSFVNLVPTPGQVFTTTGTSTIMVQFSGSASLSAAGQTMYIRATVDGTPVNPGQMSYSGTAFSSISYAGFLPRVAAGTHTVTMQWMVTGGTGAISNRTFTVWVIPN